MKNFESQEEYRTAQREIIDMFDDEEFVKKYLCTDAIFNSCFELLIRDASPFEIIKIFIKDRQTLLNKIHELISLMPPPRIIKTN